MAQHVRILDFLHELRNAGVDVDYGKLVHAPDEFWRDVPYERRAALAARVHLEARPDAPVRIRILRKRGDPSIDGVYVELEPEEAAPGPFQRARAALLYRPIEVTGPPEPDGPDARRSAPPGPLEIPVFLLRGSPRKAASAGVLETLDAAWGGEPYDISGDGAFCEFVLPPDHVELDRYEVEAPFSQVCIHRDAEDGTSYSIIEPRLTELERSLAGTINERLRDLLVRDVDKGAPEGATRLAEVVFELLRIYRVDLDRRSAYRLGYHLLRNYLGFGRLDVLMRDPYIEDISCNGPELPVYVVHSKHQNLSTDLRFDEMELNSFTIKLAQRGGKLLSIAQPLVDATLPGGSRIQASLGREITSRGSAFTIRKFRDDPLTIVDLIRSKTHSFDSAAALWLVAQLRRNLVVMGATASGKTTTLNCLSQFIPPSVKIVTIEDTREITLQHENWLAAVTRESVNGSEAERISMFDLLRAAMRQRPEYIIVGEIRGQEGLTLFQAMATGHTCFSTMHAGSVENAVYRLENAPINVPRVMLTSLDFLLLQGQVEVGGNHVRRMLALTELNGVDSTTRNLRTNDVFRWNPERDEVELVSNSYVLEQARMKRGWSRAQLDEEIALRRAVLEGLVARKQRNYRDVAKAVRDFYADQAARGIRA